MVADPAPLVEAQPFASRELSLGYANPPNCNIEEDAYGNGSGLSLASLVEMEHRKLILWNNRGRNSSHSSDDHENHSCEDEELVITPMPGLKGLEVSPYGRTPTETFAAEDDHYESGPHDLMIFATN